MRDKHSEILYDGPETTRQVFTNKNSHPLVLDLVLLKEFGPSYLEWEPETCWAEIRQTWGTTISETNRNKVQAVRTCHVSSQPYEAWEIFEKVAAGLFGLMPRFDYIQKATPHRACVSLDVITQIKENKSVLPEVYKYAAATMLDYGMIYGTGALTPCNKYTAKMAGKTVQDKVKEAVEQNKRPKFDGTNDSDIQLMKSLSVRDYSDSVSKMLVGQLKRVIP
jgi:hypothetical protein